MSIEARTPSNDLPAAPRHRRAHRAGPFVLGLVGPAGAGKSTVARGFLALGARIVDGDALIAEYGEHVYRSDGTLDRAQVAAKVFRDPAALERLNQLVHPRILAQLRAAITNAEATRSHAALVLDAALLLDWGFERECDAVLAVLAPRSQQITRLVATRGWHAEEAERRLQAARTDDSFRSLADHVLMNDGRESDTVAAANAWLTERLRAHARAGA
jgi:dephospho-CoA kinase